MQPVLTHGLFQIRPHLPALARFPRTYSRCEPTLPPTPGATKGALVLIKDARDAIFSVRMVNRLWLERGGYYRSGES